MPAKSPGEGAARPEREPRGKERCTRAELSGVERAERADIRNLRINKVSVGRDEGNVLAFDGFDHEKHE